jgi:hypothetical protein
MNSFEEYYNTEMHEYNHNQIGEEGGIDGHTIGEITAETKEWDADDPHDFNRFDDNFVDQFGNPLELGSSCGDPGSSSGNQAKHNVFVNTIQNTSRGGGVQTSGRGILHGRCSPSILCLLKLITGMDHQYMFGMECFCYLKLPILHLKFKIKLKPYKSVQFLFRTIISLLIMFMVKGITEEVMAITQLSIYH